MSLWVTVLAASAGTYVEKLLGFIVPAEWLARPNFKRVAESLPVGLLSALVAYQAFGSGQTLTLDGRLFGLIVAAVALWRGASFVVVVLLAAVLTGAGRALGWLG